MQNNNAFTTGRTHETTRWVPAVDAMTATLLNRPASAHRIVEMWEQVSVLADPCSPIAGRSFKQNRRIGFRRVMEG